MLIVQVPDSRQSERDYILSVMLRDELGLDFASVVEERSDWRLSLEGVAGALSLPDVLLGVAAERWLTPESLPAVPLRRWSQPAGAGGSWPELPVIYGRADHSGAGDEVALPIDVFGSAFFMLTRYEEHVKSDADQHGRFPASAALAVQEGFIERPVVNELCDALWRVLVTLWPGLRRRERVFSIELSHDVDWISSVRQPATRVARLLGGDLLRRRDPELLWRRLAAAMRARAGNDDLADPVDTFDFIMNASEERGLKSAFYFLSNADRGGTFHNEAYSLDGPQAQGLLRSIHERGHEVGLHGSYDSWRDGEQLACEFRRLREAAGRAGFEQSSWGGRQHFLRFSVPETWAGWAAAGLAYDASVGFAEAPGFRCGIAGPFKTFDLVAGAALDLVERPLVAMEGSFLDRKYGGMSFEEAPSRMLAFADVCRRHRGVFTLLWHNSSLARRVERVAYLDVLNGLARRP